MDANQISESCQSLIQGTRYLVYRHQYLFGRDMSRLADRPLRLSHCSGDQLWLGSKYPTHNLEVRGIIIVQENNNFTYKMTISQDGRSHGSQNRIMRDALGTAHRTYKRSVVKLRIHKRIGLHHLPSWLAVCIDLLRVDLIRFMMSHFIVTNVCIFFISSHSQLSKLHCCCV